MSVLIFSSVEVGQEEVPKGILPLQMTGEGRRRKVVHNDHVYQFHDMAPGNSLLLERREFHRLTSCIGTTYDQGCQGLGHLGKPPRCCA